MRRVPTIIAMLVVRLDSLIPQAVDISLRLHVQDRCGPVLESGADVTLAARGAAAPVLVLDQVRQTHALVAHFAVLLTTAAEGLGPGVFFTTAIIDTNHQLTAACTRSHVEGAWRMWSRRMQRRRKAVEARELELALDICVQPGSQTVAKSCVYGGR